MRNRTLIRFTAIGMAAFIALAPINAQAATLLKRGSRGNEVTVVQTTLKKLGYYTYPKTTGYYGGVTEAAVKRFQKANGIYSDGIFGKNTRNILYGNTKSLSITKVSIKKTMVVEASETSGALDWFSKVRDVWKRGMDAVVIDVDTEKSFQVKRTYGTNHADVEPLTKEDTKTIKDIWGGFSWKRRAVVVQIGKYTIAGSMTAMPHAGLDSADAGKYVSWRSDGYGRGFNLDAVKYNGASGVMDIHFKNSRTHTTNTKQKSQQDMVQKAAAYIQNMQLLQEAAKEEEYAKNAVKLADANTEDAVKVENTNTENMDLNEDTVKNTEESTENVSLLQHTEKVVEEETENMVQVKNDGNVTQETVNNMYVNLQ